MLVDIQKRTFKLIIIGSFLALVAALIIAWNNPATGYEVDIYESTPLLTWTLLIFAAVCGAGIIIQQAVTGGYNSSRMWLTGLMLLVISRFSLLYVPYIRGYFTWSGDNISHWGLVKNILSSGAFSTGNLYPITHSLLAQIILITNVPIQYVTNLSTAFLSVFFIIATYLLATTILPKRSQQLTATAIAGIVFIEGGYDVLLMPNGWSILMIPLLFYFYFKRQSNLAYAILFLLTLAIYPFFHPISALTIGAVLLAILIVKWFLYRILKKKGSLVVMLRPTTILTPFMFLMIIFIMWILAFNLFKVNIRLMWEQITSGGPDVMGEIGDILSKIHMSGFDAVILYIKLYGSSTFIIILSLIGILLIVLKLIKIKDNETLPPVIDIAIAFLSFGFLYLLYLAGLPGMQSVGAHRMLAYVVLFSPVLGAVALYGIIQFIRFKYLSCIVLMVLLMIPGWLSFRGLYRSPYNIYANLQITQADMTGMTWLISKKSTIEGCVHIISPPFRYASGILGMTGPSIRYDIRSIQMPAHFGYHEYTTLGEQFSADKYVGITKVDSIVYSILLSVLDRFNESDFVKLDEDHTVRHLYSNGEMNVYYVQTTAPSH